MIGKVYNPVWIEVDLACLIAHNNKGTWYIGYNNQYLPIPTHFQNGKGREVDPQAVNTLLKGMGFGWSIRRVIEDEAGTLVTEWDRHKRGWERTINEHTF